MINVHQVLLDYRQLKIKQLEIIQKEIITKWIYYKFKIQIGINQNNPSLKTALSFKRCALVQYLGLIQERQPKLSNAPQGTVQRITLAKYQILLKSAPGTNQKYQE
uniref:Uncharacterized protein n=1 Tax=Rhizophagus irregularis (strain DAOM 181602 / DAOM 197198 / MUCL 43194) TaxID=747089 RepID=U9U886_RHIID